PATTYTIPAIAASASTAPPTHTRDPSRDAGPPAARTPLDLGAAFFTLALEPAGFARAGARFCRGFAGVGAGADAAAETDRTESTSRLSRFKSARRSDAV